MSSSSARHASRRFENLHTLLGRLRLRPAGAGPLERRRFRPRLEQLEDRIALNPSLLVGPNVNITKAAGNQAESTISINPTNRLNLFESDTLSTVGRYSTDGGQTWKVSDMSALPASIGDVQTAWDSFGNLFLTEIRLSDFSIMVARSSDGGATFKDVRIIASSAFSDQPSIAVGPRGVAGVAGAVWVSFTNSSNQLVADGAPVNGLDSVGAFQTPEIAPGPGGDFGGIAIGPNGQVLVNYQNNGSGIGPDTM
jgi:hypothetical protein